MNPLPFHPAVAQWFNQTFQAPSECQRLAWDAIRAGQHALIASPTGTGKTLAAFLAAIDELVKESTVFGLPDETRVLYISPLKALSNDVHRNLEQPLAGIHQALFEAGSTQLTLTSAVRTGDTPTARRTAMTRQPPHILVTTPESVYLLLTSEKGRAMLRTVRWVIVDEIHALTGSKRGSHLVLSLERLERLTQYPPIRIGLSATQHPIHEVAQFLTGGRPCTVIDIGHRRSIDLAIELPKLPLETVLSQEAASDVYDQMARLVESHKTTLVFVNTRRLSERVARALSDRLGEEHVTAHHGSLSREQRFSAEERLKSGHLKALVATASLELGIDIGDVDLVCQLGSTGSIATLLQRVGRSGHHQSGIPKGRIFPTSRDDLIECIALLDAIHRGELDRVHIPHQPLDVLAQQMVAMSVHETWPEDELYRCVRQAYPYRDLSRETFDALTTMLVQGFGTRRGIRGAYLHRDGIYQRLMARKGARLTAITCGGAIPDNAEYRVILEPSGELLGMVDEDFAIDSMVGDIFQLGNASWRILRVESAAMRVEDARHLPPSIPFWFGERPGRTDALSLAVSRLRAELEIHMGDNSPAGLEVARRQMQLIPGVSALASQQAVDYLAAARLVLGVLPTHETIVFERFFDESGGMQFIVHAPYGNRVNRAWGLALRKRFCRSFNFELQAAANEEAILLSLGTSQSFPLEEPSRFLNPRTLRDLLIQAVLAAPMFTVRWRWNAVCALAVKRFQGGRKTPPYLVRMQAEDLVTAVFPDQLACLENIAGDREIPDHPLVEQTLHDCLTEAMDITGLIELITGIECGTVRVVCRDLTEPSPLAAGIVNARAYSFLDDAPLEERRTRAVVSRRWLDPATADDLGQLDPAAIAKVRQELNPIITDADGLHETLIQCGFLCADEQALEWANHYQVLKHQRRAITLIWEGRYGLWLAAEYLPRFKAVYVLNADTPRPSSLEHPAPVLEPADAWASLPEAIQQESWTVESALREILRLRLSHTGPITAHLLADQLKLPLTHIEQALMALEGEGFVLRGRFTPDAAQIEWCERRLLARVHRYTLHRLRQAIEPVSQQVFMRYLLRWQRVDAEHRLRGGSDSLMVLLAQLEGFEAAAAAWEMDILSARLDAYDPDWLDGLCVSGRITWLRLTPAEGLTPVKTSPIALVSRNQLKLWLTLAQHGNPDTLSASARFVAQILAERGALFLDELTERSGLLKTQMEPVLGELVARGYVSSDSFKGLRALLIPEQKKKRFHALAASLGEAGRWTLRREVMPSHAAAGLADDQLTTVAMLLLRRYGVVFKAMLSRENSVPAWHTLLPIYRRLEARGELRGGRFVAGGYGEQFALPEAVEALRAVKKQPESGEIVVLSAVDPLNLPGIITSGQRVPSLPGNRLLYRDGLLLAIQTGQAIRFIEPVERQDEWPLRQRLERHPIPPKLRAWT